MSAAFFRRERSVEIVKARERDAAGYNAAIGEVAKEGKWLSVTEGFSLKESRAFTRYCKKTKSVQLFLRDGRRIVGWCDVVPASDDATGSLGIGILECCRGQGYGGKLLDEALRLCKKRFERVVLYVRKDNERAVSLYLSRGFAVTAELKENTYKNVPVPVLVMGKTIDEKD